MCFANCDNDTENINFIFTNGSYVEGIEITQKCTAESLCTMKNQLDAISTQQLEAIQNAQAVDNGRSFLTWPGFSFNTTTNFTTQTLSNSTTQIIDSVCEASAENNISNINVFVSDSSEVGGIYIGQDGSAVADCNMENTARSYSSQEATSDQTAYTANGSALVIIFMILAIIVIVIALSFLAYKLKKDEIVGTIQIQKSKNEMCAKADFSKSPELAIACAELISPGTANFLAQNNAGIFKNSQPIQQSGELIEMTNVPSSTTSITTS